MKERGFPSMVYYKIPLHLQVAYKKLGYRNGEFPISEHIAQRILSLPMHPYLDKDIQDEIISTFNSII